MRQFFYKYFKKLFVKQWVIGLSKGDIKDIIRTKNFDPVIKWLPMGSIDYFHADPFPVKTKEGKLNILYESFVFDDFYGTISVMSIDPDLNKSSQKVLLDTKSHLSYPFVFIEDSKIYMFPEAAHSGKLSCYQYNADTQTINYLQEVINLPLLDSTILKFNGKYWLFGTLIGKDSNKKLYMYFSDNLLGPYKPHPGNPLKDSAHGSRPAGNIIEVDGQLYRPSQNCENQYGESITINKIKVLNEESFNEEPYMLVSINKNRDFNKTVLTMHTLNIIDDIIIVDGLKMIYSPKNQLINFIRNRKYGWKTRMAKENLT